MKIGGLLEHCLQQNLATCLQVANWEWVCLGIEQILYINHL